jgi:putative hydroxymethylpyrimidine transport system ATP-binding protein
VTVGAAAVVRDLVHDHGREPRAVRALDGVSFEVRPGELVAVLGPSGCGKSTLLRILAGLIEPTAGTVDVEGRVAYMSQRDALLPWRRSVGNATLGAVLGGVDRRDAERRASALFDTFGLAGFERSWPWQLSGGMRQRLALLRTFLTPADTLLLDEPFGALDAITRRQFQQWFEKVWIGDPRSVVLVTHDLEEALLLADRVVVMSSRPGRIVEEVAAGFGRPRDPTLVLTEPFVRAKGALWAALR